MNRKQIGFFLGPAMSAGIGFIMIVLLTNIMGPEIMGQYSLFTTLSNLVLVVILLGTDVAYLRDIPDVKQTTTLYQAGSLPIMLSILSGLVLILFRNCIPERLFPSDIGFIGIFSAVMIIGMVFQRFGTTYLRARELGWSYSLWTVTPQLVSFILILYGFFNRRSWFYSESASNQLLFLVGLIAVPQLLVGVLRYYISASNELNGKKPICLFAPHLLSDRSTIKRLVSFGVPLVFANLMTLLLVSVDKVMLATYGTVGDVGIYATAARIAQVLMLAQAPFASVWWPVAFRWYESSIVVSRFKTICVLVSAVFLTLSLVVTFISRPLMSLLGSSYRESYLLAPLMMLHPLAYVVSEVTSVGITFTRKTQLNMLVSGVALVINVTLNALLIPEMGATGAAIATGLAWIIFLAIRSLLGAIAWNHTGVVYAYTSVGAYLCFSIAYAMCLHQLAIVLFFIVIAALIILIVQIVLSRSELSFLHID